MHRLLKILFSIPRTIWFNFKYLPFIQAAKLPIWLANNVRVKEMHRGRIHLFGKIRVGMIRIGYHEADGVDVYSTHTIISVAEGGRIFFSDDAHIGQGAILRVNKDAELYLGKNFAISGTTTIVSSKKVSFGNDVQLSWNSLIMDGDAHKIFDSEGIWINESEEIIIGNKVWIGVNTTVLKGTKIGDCSVVASNSLVNKNYVEDHCIIGGQPARVLKKISDFEI